MRRQKIGLGDSETALEQAEQQVGGDGEEGGGDGAGENYGVADHGDAAENEGAEAAGADGRGDGSDADGDDGGGANTCENYGARERETNAPEDLRLGHTHGFGGFENGGVNASEADVRVAEDGQQCVQDEGDDSGASADTPDEGNWD